MSSTINNLSRHVGVTYPAVSRLKPDGTREYGSLWDDDSDDAATETTTRVPISLLLGRRVTRNKSGNQMADTEKFCKMYREGFMVGAKSKGNDKSLVKAKEERLKKGKLTEKWFVEGFCDGYKFAQPAKTVSQRRALIPTPIMLKDDPPSLDQPDGETLIKLAKEMKKALDL